MDRLDALRQVYSKMVYSPTGGHTDQCFTEVEKAVRGFDLLANLPVGISIVREVGGYRWTDNRYGGTTIDAGPLIFLADTLEALVKKVSDNDKQKATKVSASESDLDFANILRGFADKHEVELAAASHAMRTLPAWMKKIEEKCQKFISDD